jgi:hypothetical protein
MSHPKRNAVSREFNIFHKEKIADFKGLLILLKQ